MLLVHHRRAETTLPEMAGAPAPRLNDAGVTAMHRREHAAQPVAVGRHQDQMHVVGHQAPRPHLDIGRPAMLAEEVAVKGVVGVAKERTRATVAALRDVVRVTGDDDASEAGHAGSWQRSADMSIKCTVTVMPPPLAGEGTSFDAALAGEETSIDPPRLAGEGRVGVDAAGVAATGYPVAENFAEIASFV